MASATTYHELAVVSPGTVVSATRDSLKVVWLTPTLNRHRAMWTWTNAQPVSIDAPNLLQWRVSTPEQATSVARARSVTPVMATSARQLICAMSTTVAAHCLLESAVLATLDRSSAVLVHQASLVMVGSCFFISFISSKWQLLLLSGTSCSQLDGDVCSSKNGGCSPQARCTANTAISVSYRDCRCPPGTTGTGVGANGCTQVTGDSSSMTCQPSNPCRNGGTCIPYRAGVYCSCPATFSGTFCEKHSVNACSSNPCQNNGVCTNLQANGYRYLKV